MMRPIQRYSPMTLRSNKPKGALFFTGVLWIGLLFAAPLSAQQTVVVPDVNVEVEPTPVTIENTIEVMSDSAMIANLNRNLEALRVELAARECDTCGGTTTVVRIGQGALVLIAAFMAWQVKKIADRPPTVHNDGDVDVEVNVPEHDHKRKRDDDHGES